MGGRIGLGRLARTGLGRLARIGLGRLAWIGLARGTGPVAGRSVPRALLGRERYSVKPCREGG